MLPLLTVEAISNSKERLFVDSDFTNSTRTLCYMYAHNLAFNYNVLYYEFVEYIILFFSMEKAPSFCMLFSLFLQITI